MPRRDAFSLLRGTTLNPTQDDGGSSSGGPKPVEPNSTVSPLDFIPTAEPSKKRERKWDKTHQGELVTYRGIPAETHQALISLAGSIGVPVDEVVRMFLEYALEHYRLGMLPLNPHPKAQRMTLFPDGQFPKAKSQQGWLHEAFPSAKPGKKSKKGKQSKPWESRATYRIPIALKEQVREIADTHSVAVGELVLYLFKFSFEAFEAGRLRLEPHPKTTGNTLF